MPEPTKPEAAPALPQSVFDGKADPLAEAMGPPAPEAKTEVVAEAVKGVSSFTTVHGVGAAALLLAVAIAAWRLPQWLPAALAARRRQRTPKPEPPRRPEPKPELEQSAPRHPPSGERRAYPKPTELARSPFAGPGDTDPDAPAQAVISPKDWKAIWKELRDTQRRLAEHESKAERLREKVGERAEGQREKLRESLDKLKTAVAGLRAEVARVPDLRRDVERLEAAVETCRERLRALGG